MATPDESQSEPFQVPTKELVCPSCKKEFVNPKLLRCLHTFCQPCVMKFKVARKGYYSFVCPYCKSFTKAKDSGGRDLQTNLYVTGLAEILASRKNIHSKCLVCSIKEEQTDATHKCLDCGDTLCLTCSMGHNSSSSTSGHLVVSIDELRKGHYDMQIMRRQSKRCVTHKADFRFYCNTCSSLICEQCAISEHRNHGHKDLETALKEKASALDKLFPQNHAIRVIAKRVLELQSEEKEFRRKLNLDVIAIVERLHRERKEVLKATRKIFQDERNLLVSHLNNASVGAVGLYTRVLGVGGNQLLAMSNCLETALRTMPKNESANLNLPLPRRIRVNIAGYHPGKEIITMTDERQNKFGVDDGLPEQKVSSEGIRNVSKDIAVEKNTAAQAKGDLVKEEINSDGKITDGQKKLEPSNTGVPSSTEDKHGTHSPDNKPEERVKKTFIKVFDNNMMDIDEDKAFDYEELVKAVAENDTDDESNKLEETRESKIKEDEEGRCMNTKSDTNEDKADFESKSRTKAVETCKDDQEVPMPYKMFKDGSLNAKKHPILAEHTDSLCSAVGKDEIHETSDVTCLTDKQDTFLSGSNVSSRLLVYRNHFQTRLQSDQNPPSISCLVFGPDESILVLDENNYKVQTFDRNCIFTSLSRRTHENFVPQITAFSDGFASAHDKMLLFCRKDLLVTKAVYLCTDLGNQTLKYFPMVCTFQEGLLVGNLPNNELRVYDVHGNILRSWKSRIPGPFTSMKYARGDRVVVSTWANNGAVYIESEKEGLILEIYRGICVRGRVEPWYPWDACVTRTGCVIVSDSLRDEISIFSPEGNLLSVTNTMENNISEPRCLLLGDNGKLFVSGNQGTVVEYMLCNI